MISRAEASTSARLGVRSALDSLGVRSSSRGQGHGLPAGVIDGHLAEGIGSNASFVRKLLAPLIEDGLVASTMGRDGGLRIGRRPERITLLDIYRSVTRGKQLWPARDDIPPRCLVSRNVGALFTRITDDVDAVVAERLGRETLASCFTGARAARCRGSPPETIQGIHAQAAHSDLALAAP